VRCLGCFFLRRFCSRSVTKSEAVSTQLDTTPRFHLYWVPQDCLPGSRKRGRRSPSSVDCVQRIPDPPDGAPNLGMPDFLLRSSNPFGIGVGKQQVVSGVVIDGREREILLIEHGARYVRDRHPIADQSGPGHVALVGEVNGRRASLRQIVFFEIRPFS
jgi:hypothetical protein